MGLVGRLAERAKAHEPGLAFDEFMRAALYDPDEGYYSTSAARAGRDGDFLSAPEASEDFAHCLANWIVAQTPQTGGSLTVLEAGAGRGTLAAALIPELLQKRPGGLDYHVFETSAAARGALETTLAAAVDDGILHVHATLADLPSRLGDGVLVANELFDNVPVRRVMMADALQEIRVGYTRGHFEEKLRPAEDSLIDYFDRLGVRLPAGQTAEVCLEAPALLSDLTDVFDACSLAVIDYGDVASRLYALERHPNGTLACHRRHGTDRGFYEMVGRKDITAHVNFTALEHVLLARGFEVQPLVTQAEFLLSHGLAQRIASHAESARAGDAITGVRAATRARQLFHPEAMGEAFRVLTARRASA